MYFYRGLNFKKTTDLHNKVSVLHKSLHSDSLPAVKRLRSRTACVDMPGVPLLSCVFLGKSLTQSEVTSFTIYKMRIITVPTPRVSQELSEIISGKRFKHAALDKY